jgi:integrase
MLLAGKSMETPSFSQQADYWLKNIQTRARNPVKPSTVAQFKSHLKWLNPRIGEVLISEINNKTLRGLVPHLDRSPQTILCYLGTVKAVIASALDDDGQPLYKREWNHEFIDLPEIGKQKTPMFSGEEIAAIVGKGNGSALLYKLAGGSGARIGELLALEPRHFDGRTLKIEQSKWQAIIQSPKTSNGYRQIDLASSLAGQLQEYVQKCTTPFLFNFSYSDALLKLHAILEELKIEKTGFHAFRRFRKTHLGKNHVGRDLIKYWLGHGAEDVTDLYDHIGNDTEFRLAETERVGLGF